MSKFWKKNSWSKNCKAILQREPTGPTEIRQGFPYYDIKEGKIEYMKIETVC
jgi:hypothetical protein